jgi:hypothetical protein
MIRMNSLQPGNWDARSALECARLDAALTDDEMRFDSTSAWPRRFLFIGSASEAGKSA